MVSQDARQRLNNWLGSCEEQQILEGSSERANERGRWSVLCEEFLKAGKVMREKAGKNFKTETLEYLGVLRKFLTTAEKKPERVGGRPVCAPCAASPRARSVCDSALSSLFTAGVQEWASQIFKLIIELVSETSVSGARTFARVLHVKCLCLAL